MNKAFLWSALFCMVLGLAACGSGSNLAHKLDKLPGKAMLLTEVKEQGITLEATAFWRQCSGRLYAGLDRLLSGAGGRDAQIGYGVE